MRQPARVRAPACQTQPAQPGAPEREAAQRECGTGWPAAAGPARAPAPSSLARPRARVRRALRVHRATTDEGAPRCEDRGSNSEQQPRSATASRHRTHCPRPFALLRSAARLCARKTLEQRLHAAVARARRLVRSPAVAGRQCVADLSICAWACISRQRARKRRGGRARTRCSAAKRHGRGAVECGRDAARLRSRAAPLADVPL